MNAFTHHLAYDFKTGIRDKSKLFMFYLFPIVFFALVGGLMVSTNPFFKQSMLPGMIVFAVMCSTLLSLPAFLVEAREAGVFRSYRINGVPAASILSIPVITISVHMVVVALIMSVAGAGLYGGVAPARLGGFILAGLLAYAAYAGIGVLIGVAARNTTVTTLVAQLIYIPSIILGGLMVPLSILPAGLQKAALLLPATHAMKVFMALGMPGSAAMPWISLVALASGTVITFVLAALLFEWDSRASVPSRKAWLALLGLLPYACAALLG
jgi:ABC-2 type transport system permease protein